MKVYQFLGTKSGTIDKTQLMLISCSALVGIFSQRIILLFIAPLVVFFSTHLIKRFWFNGREEWPFMIMRLLGKSSGSWNLNEPDDT